MTVTGSSRSLPSASDTRQTRDQSLDRDCLGAEVVQVARLGQRVDAGDLARAQRLLQALPAFDTHELSMRGAEGAPQRAVVHPQARLDLLGQEPHARLEKPIRHALLALAAIE